MKSQIFYTDRYIDIQDKIKSHINSQDQILTASTQNSTRAVGDAIEQVISKSFDSVIGLDICKNYRANFARRAMEDLAFNDIDNLYYVVDVKTHRLDTRFNMPNLTSVRRLAEFYEDDKNYFVILMISYIVENFKIISEKVNFIPIEFLSWECLTIGALGWGQVQIANASNIKIVPHNSSKLWMMEFCDRMLDFYPNEINKSKKRLNHFKKIRDKWNQKAD